MAVFSHFFLPKMGVKVFFSYSNEDTVSALVFILYDGSLTNNLLVVILFHNCTMHIF